MIKAILCVDKQGAIGQNGDMPWGRSFPKDLEYFKRVTSEDIVVMGSKTWKSLPFYPKGLPKRDKVQRAISEDSSSLSIGLVGRAISRQRFDCLIGATSAKKGLFVLQ